MMSLGLAALGGWLVLLLVNRGPVRTFTAALYPTAGPGPLVPLMGWIGPSGLGMAGVSLASPALGVGGPMVWLMVARLMQTRRQRRLVAWRDSQVLAMVDQIGHELRSGQSLPHALSFVLKSQPLESFPELDQLSASLAAGERLEVALRRLQTTVESLRLFTVAITVLVESGGPVSVAIDRLADTLRARQAALDETRTQASQATASAAVLAGLPLVFGSLLAIADHRIASFYAQSFLGAVCLVGALGLVGIGWAWMDHLVWS